MDIAALNGSVMTAFAEPELVLYRPGRGQAGPFEVRGIFDRYQIEIPSPGDGAPVSTKVAHLQVCLADFPPGVEPAAQDRVQIRIPGRRDIAFDVKDAEPDGKGWATLQLGYIGEA